MSVALALWRGPQSWILAILKTYSANSPLPSLTNRFHFRLTHASNMTVNQHVCQNYTQKASHSTDTTRSGHRPIVSGLLSLRPAPLWKSAGCGSHVAHKPSAIAYDVASRLRGWAPRWFLLPRLRSLACSEVLRSSCLWAPQPFQAPNCCLWKELHVNTVLLKQNS